MRRKLPIAAVVSLVGLALFAWWSQAPAPAEPAPARAQSRSVRPRPVAAAAPAAPVADEASEPDETRVLCETGPAPEGRVWRVWGMHEGGGGVLLDASWEGSRLRFEVPPAITSAVIAWAPTADPTRLTLDGGRCTVGTMPPPADAPLFGKVRGAADLPDGTVFLEGCGARDDDPVDADGGFFVQAEAGRCSMRAWRQAGALRLPGPWVEVDAVAGREMEVEISVPTFEPAGVGMGIEAVGDGIAVTFLVDGGPGATAGLAVGDVVTSVNGVPTQGMDLEDYIQHAIGPPGSPVRLEGVGADGEPFDVSARRALIDPGVSRPQ